MYRVSLHSTQTKIVTIAFCIAMGFHAIAQKRSLKFDHFGVSEGLSQGTIGAILQDSRGFMWFGTRDGLNKYDGYTFTVYKNIPNNPGSLSNNNVQHIIEDKKGNLWMATYGGGLVHFDREKERFKSYKHDNNNPNSLSADLVFSILYDSRGKLWVGTQDGGVDVFDIERETFIHYIHQENDSKSLGGNFVTDILEDAQHRIWIATADGGLNLLNNDYKTFTHFLHDPKNNNSISSDNVWALFEDSKQRLWVGTRGAGLNLFENSTNTFRHFVNNPSSKNSLAHNSILSFEEDKQHKLWIGTENGGVSTYDIDKNLFENYRHDDVDNNSLTNNSIYSLYEDNRGNMWVGTYSGGINYLNWDANKFTHYKHTTEANSLSHNEVNTIYEDSKNNVWIGTDGGGLNLFDRKTKLFKNFRHDPGNVNSIGSNHVLSIVEDGDHNLWIGTWGDGITIYNPAKNTFRHIRHNPDDPGSLSSNNVWAILKDADNNMWIGLYFGTGLDLYEKKSNSFKHYVYDKKNPDGISSQNINNIFEDRDGYLWVCTDGEGIDKFDKNTQRFSHFKHNEASNTISGNTVYNVYQDNDGNFWFGTNAGLNFYDPQKNKFKVYTTQDGLPNDVVFGILEDGNHNLWLSTHKGLSKFDRKNKTFRNFTRADGLQSDEFSRANAYCKTRSGMMYFGGNNGFNEFFPSEIVEQPFDPNLVLTDFQIFNKRTPIGNDSTTNTPLKKHISETEEIVISYKHAVFTFEFASLNYTDINKKQYAYMLEGFDKNWNYVGAKRVATYTNLNPGKYTFKIKGLDNQGNWSKKIRTLRVIITPPFWKTWWFIATAIMILAAGVFFIYRFRLRAVENQKHELETQVKLRTEELMTQKEMVESQTENMQTLNEQLQAQTDFLQSMNEELQQQKVEIILKQEQAEQAMQEAEQANRAKSIFLATMSHEIRTPMNGVIGMASLLSETSQTSEQQEYTETIKSCGESLLVVINDILDYSKIESGKMELEEKDFDLRTCIEEVLDVFAGKAAQSKLDLVYEIDYNVPSQIIGDGLRLRQIIMNLVGNAIKFTQEGEIFVGVHLKSSNNDQIELSFEIRDTGIGIPKDKIDRLFKAFSQVDSSTTRKYGGTGLGLVICEKLVTLMGGHINVKSTPGMGTTFTFSIKTTIAHTSTRTYVYSTMVGLEGKRILVVDDNQTNRSILKNQLTQWKLVPVLANSGHQALDILEADKNFDLIITDMQMPEMDGMELARHIRSRRSDVPIILLSSIGDERTKAHAELFNVMLTKPVRQGALHKNVFMQLKKEGKLPVVEKQEVKKLSVNFSEQYPFQILITEDNPVNQKLAERVLTKLGYKPAQAYNGEEALHALQKEKYDIIFMDVQMPVMDGLEATRQIRQLKGAQPIIVAMTANAMQGDREICLEAGMDEYVSKPIRLEDLTSLLEKYGERTKTKTIDNR